MIREPLSGDPLGAVGPLAELLQKYLERDELSIRQAAVKADVSHQSLNNILAGRVRAPQHETIIKLHRGLGIPLRELSEAAARTLEQSYVIEDIGSAEALQIAVARIDEVPPEELANLRVMAEEILREIKDRRPPEESANQ